MALSLTNDSPPSFESTLRSEQGTNSVVEIHKSVQVENVVEKKMSVNFGVSKVATEALYDKTITESVDLLYSMAWSVEAQLKCCIAAALWMTMQTYVTPELRSDQEKVQDAIAVCNLSVLFPVKIPTPGYPSMHLDNSIETSYLMAFIPPLFIKDEVFLDRPQNFVTKGPVYDILRKTSGKNAARGRYYYIVLLIGGDMWDRTNIDYDINFNPFSQDEPKEADTPFYYNKLYLSKKGFDALFSRLNMEHVGISYSDRLELTMGAFTAAMHTLGNNLLQDTAVVIGSPSMSEMNTFNPCVYIYDFGKASKQLVMPGLRHIEDISMSAERQREAGYAKARLDEDIDWQSHKTELYPVAALTLAEARNKVLQQNKDKYDYLNPNFVCGYNFALIVIHRILNHIRSLDLNSVLIKNTIPAEYFPALHLSGGALERVKPAIPDPITIFVVPEKEK